MSVHYHSSIAFCFHDVCTLCKDLSPALWICICHRAFPVQQRAKTQQCFNHYLVLRRQIIHTDPLKPLMARLFCLNFDGCSSDGSSACHFNEAASSILFFTTLTFCLFQWHQTLTFTEKKCLLSPSCLIRYPCGNTFTRL